MPRRAVRGALRAPIYTVLTYMSVNAAAESMLAVAASARAGEAAVRHRPRLPALAAATPQQSQSYQRRQGVDTSLRPRAGFAAAWLAHKVRVFLFRLRTRLVRPI